MAQTAPRRSAHLRERFAACAHCGDRNESCVFAAGLRPIRLLKRAASRLHFSKRFEYQRNAIDVIEPGTQTTVQDYPGRLGYWHVGVPPSGPMDALAFRIANRLVGNPDSAAGLEIAVTGPDAAFRERYCDRADRRGFRRAAGWHARSAVAVDSVSGGLDAGDDDVARGAGAARIWRSRAAWMYRNIWRAAARSSWAVLADMRAGRCGRAMWLAIDGGRAAILLHAEGAG